MQAGAATLLGASLWPGALQAADAATAQFTFVVLNDLHFLDEKCGPHFQSLVAQIKATRPSPDFCLLAGDLSEHGTARQLAAVRDIFRGIGMPVHAVPGNHDWTTDQDRTAWDKIWPGASNFTLDHKGWQVVALDTTEGRKPGATAQKPTLDFLDRTLPKLDRNRPMIVVTHMPLGFLVPYRLTNAGEILDRLKPYNLRAVFNGHFPPRRRGHAARASPRRTGAARSAAPTTIAARKRDISCAARRTA